MRQHLLGLPGTQTAAACMLQHLTAACVGSHSLVLLLGNTGRPAGAGLIMRPEP
jgi:hypothetical protein